MAILLRRSGRVIANLRAQQRSGPVSAEVTTQSTLYVRRSPRIATLPAVNYCETKQRYRQSGRRSHRPDFVAGRRPRNRGGSDVFELPARQGLRWSRRVQGLDPEPDPEPEQDPSTPPSHQASQRVIPPVCTDDEGEADEEDKADHEDDDEDDDEDEDDDTDYDNSIVAFDTDNDVADRIRPLPVHLLMLMMMMFSVVNSTLKKTSSSTTTTVLSATGQVAVQQVQQQQPSPRRRPGRNVRFPEKLSDCAVVVGFVSLSEEYREARIMDDYARKVEEAYRHKAYWTEKLFGCAKLHRHRLKRVHKQLQDDVRFQKYSRIIGKKAALCVLDMRGLLRITVKVPRSNPHPFRRSLQSTAFERYIYWTKNRPNHESAIFAFINTVEADFCRALVREKKESLTVNL
jgi:hypothetical protein